MDDLLNAEIMGKKMPKMIFQPKVLAVFSNLMVLKIIEYAQSFQMLYVILFVTTKIMTL